MVLLEEAKGITIELAKYVYKINIGFLNNNYNIKALLKPILETLASIG